MGLTLIVCGCLLLAQDAGNEPPGQLPGQTSSESPDGIDLPDLSDPLPEEVETLQPLQSSDVQPDTLGGQTEPVVLRGTPPDMVAASLELPLGSSIQGQPVTLLEAMDGANNPRARKAVADAYWDLTHAVADYRAAWDVCSRIQQLRPRTVDEGIWQAALIGANAASDGAELRVLRAQYALAESARWSVERELPLPSDLPHIGEYVTRYQQIVADRALPAVAGRLDRVLPLTRREIESRARAAEAATAGLREASIAYLDGTISLHQLLAAITRLARQQTALVQVVCQYNHDIAEYVLAVSEPSVASQTLVAMLIKSSNRSAQPSGASPRGIQTFADPSDVRHAAHNEPAHSPQEPTLATDQTQDNAQGEAAKAADAAKEADTVVVRRPGIAAIPETSVASSEETDAGVSEETDNAADPEKTVAVPSEETDNASEETQTQETVLRVAPPVGLYSGLVDSLPANRPTQLTDAFYLQRSLPEIPETTDASLLDAMTSTSRDRMGGTIDAYWKAARCMAAYQLLCDKEAFLDELLPSVQERATDAAGREAWAGFQTIRSEIMASRFDAQRTLTDALGTLNAQTGRSTDDKWLLPSTPPHAGRYALQLDKLSEELAESLPVQRLADMIPRLGEQLIGRAGAVVEADASRAGATADYEAGTRELDDVLHAINGQFSQSEVYLNELTEYNQKIAEYAVRILPDLPATQLVHVLVIAP